MRSPDGTVVLLSELDEGARGEVVHVEDEPEVVFRELLGRGIHLGMDVVVRSRTDRGIAIEADGRDVTLASLAAANVSVRPRPVANGADGRSPAEQPRTLADLELGRSASVTRISPACRGIERRRLMDLGIVSGTAITPERRSLTGDPTVYLVRGTRIALRREQAMTILVEPDGESRKAAS
jgi:DtxR family Mn-dependent transcriptional regulator